MISQTDGLCEPINRRFARKNQSGLTIVELMISLALGLIIVLVAITLLLSTKAAYDLEDDVTRIHDSGRYAIDTISRAVRQTGFRNWDQTEGVVLTDKDTQPAVFGMDAKSLKANAVAIEGALAGAINGSDILVLRYFGIGSPQADGSVVNCAGFSVGAAPDGSTVNEVNESRGWSIFYVATDAAGEPELRCKYQGKSGWTSDAIARGVESFQILYGIDTDGDGLPNRFLNASAIDALDAASISSKPATPAAIPSGPSRSNWLNVVTIDIALLIRGSLDVRSESSVLRFDLLGQAYSELNSITDPGTLILKNQLPLSTRGKARKIFRFSIQLRPQIFAGSLPVEAKA